jgi:ribosomal protein L16 Arg81 hydroxylase
VSLQQLLGELPVASFLADYFQRKPLRRDCGLGWDHPVADWAVAHRALEAGGEDLLIARDGQPWTGVLPGSIEELRRLHGEGYSIAVRRADRYDGPLAHMARALATELHGKINLHVYFTRPGPGGFGWHFDPEEVFLFQAKGSKGFAVRENTQQPWPRLETMDTSLSAQAEATPMSEYEIACGSWLYIPSGFWHSATVLAESITISLGLLTPSVLDALELVRGELLRSAEWRRRLPPLGSTSGLSDKERSAVCRHYFSELAQEISRKLGSEDMPAKFFGATGWWAQR